MRTARTSIVVALAGFAALVISGCANLPPSNSTGSTTAPAAPTTVISVSTSVSTFIPPATVTVTQAPSPTPTPTPTETVYVPGPNTYPRYPLPPVYQQSAGLYCRDLKAMGYNWSEAIAYWNYWGDPDNMDIDLNGIPCETVY